MLQNHPGEREYPVKPDSILRAFEYMPRGQEIFGRVLIFLAIICGGVALIAYGILSDSTKPPKSGYLLVAALGSVAVICVAGLFWMGRRASLIRIREQQSYYALGQFGVTVTQVHLEALQLDGFNGEIGWTETLEHWPALVRFPNKPPKFRTFSLIQPEEAKMGLDQDWGVLSTEGYVETVNMLFAGLHSRHFLELASGHNGADLIGRIASVAEIPRSEVESTLIDTAQPAKLLWAWDLWRVIPLSRNAFAAGLVTEQEAWAQILKASSMVHALFEDLPSYHKNLCIGHAFWSNDYAASRARRERLHAFERNEPPRPIRHIPWTRSTPDMLPPPIVLEHATDEDTDTDLNFDFDKVAEPNRLLH
jgi:hypothetical protein